MEPSLATSSGSADAKAPQDPGSASAVSISSSASAGNTHQRSPSVSSINRSSHRQSFAENLRNIPPSPRQRHHSLTQAAVQELLNNPPSANRHLNPKFANREWREITIGELVSPSDVRWVEMDSSVEEATIVSFAILPSVGNRSSSLTILHGSYCSRVDPASCSSVRTLPLRPPSPHLTSKT